MVKSIRAAYNNEAFISPRIASAIMSRITELAKVRAGMGLKPREANGLTPRERQVLDLLGRGLSNQEIADYLVIEVGTAKNYVHSILKKLEVNSRQDAVAYMLLAQDPAGNLLADVENAA
jgi:DNA-binding NarL/FixJ family response regulator